MCGAAWHQRRRMRNSIESFVLLPLVDAIEAALSQPPARGESRRAAGSRRPCTTKALLSLPPSSATARHPTPDRRRRTALPRPRPRSARRSCSIFIASITISGVPASTFWPRSTSTAITLPGIGAVRRPPPCSASPACASRLRHSNVSAAPCVNTWKRSPSAYAAAAAHAAERHVEIERRGATRPRERLRGGVADREARTRAVVLVVTVTSASRSAACHSSVRR